MDQKDLDDKRHRAEQSNRAPVLPSMKRHTEHGAMQFLEGQRKASEDHARHENAKEEKRNPKYKETMDKVRAAMKEHELPYWDKK